MMLFTFFHITSQKHSDIQANRAGDFLKFTLVVLVSVKFLRYLYFFLLLVILIL